MLNFREPRELSSSGVNRVNLHEVYNCLVAGTTKLTRRNMSQDEVYEAMVEFLGTFPTLSGAPPTDIEELSDGVALFEALSEM